MPGKRKSKHTYIKLGGSEHKKLVLRQTWQYGVNRRCVPPPFFFVHYPLIKLKVVQVQAELSDLF